MDKVAVSIYKTLENNIIFGRNTPFYVPEAKRWNRAEFYHRKTLLCDYNDANVEIKLNDLTSVEGIFGIWSIWGKMNNKSIFICLDVHETLDIGYEIRMHEKNLNFARETDWDDSIYTEHNRFNLFKRSKAITQWQQLKYVLVSKNIAGKINREIIEAQYAWDHMAVYWNKNQYQPLSIEALQSLRKNAYAASLR